MNALAHSSFFWIALILGLLGLYILPSVIAAIRGVEGLGWIIILNLLPAGVGWGAALLGALILPRREPPAPPVAFQYSSPHNYYLPASYTPDRQESSAPWQDTPSWQTRISSY
jgi:hypothetical protein